MEQWQNSTTPLIWLTAGCIVIIIFITFIIIFGRILIQRIRKEAKIKQDILVEHQKELLKNTIQSEEEKRRIALFLHDDVLANLHRVKLLNNNPAISQSLNQSMDKLRRISHDLIPPLIEEMPFDEIMRDFLSFLTSKYTLSIHSVRTNKTFLELNKKMQLFRIFQALTVNILKHAEANEITILWKRTYDYSCFIIEDDGIGIPLNSKKGLGLKNIEMRAKTLDAKSRFKSPPNKGTRFIILIPTKSND